MPDDETLGVEHVALLETGRGRVLLRPRLEAFLQVLVDPARSTRMALVCAGPGYGKTTLVRSWCERQAEPTAYVSFQGLHPHPAQFWRMVLLAITQADPSLASAVDGLSVPDRAGQTDIVVDLADALAEQPLLFVLDDLHSVVDPDTLRDLEQLLRRLPSSVRTILLSRAEPPLASVHDGQMSGTLHQLRSNALAFNADEVAHLCTQLDPDQHQLVMEHTEGWPAMVRLMDVALQEGLHVTEIWDREIELFDYLFAEMLNRQLPAAQEVLLMSSIADPVPLTMVVELTGHADAGTMLDRAARQSGLITRGTTQESATYHLHPILRAFLNGEFLRRDLTAKMQAHLEAAHWYLSHGDGLRAVEHARRSQDPAGVEDVLASTGLALVNAGESDHLVSALAVGPTHVPGPWESVVTAAALLDLGRTAEAAALLLGVSQDALPGTLRSVHSAALWHLARMTGNPPLATCGSERDGGAADAMLFRSLHQGIVRMRQGQLDEAESDLVHASQLAQGLGRPGALVGCLTMLAEVASARSDFHQLARRAQQAVDAAEQAGWARSKRAAFPHLFAGWAARQSLDDERARHHATTAMALVDPDEDPSLVLAVTALHGVTLFETDTGIPSDAQRLHDLWRRAREQFLSPELVVYAAIADAHLSMGLGRTDRLHSISEDIRRRLGDTPDAMLVEAMHQLGRGHRRSAARLLREVAAGTPVVPFTHAEAMSLSARLCLEDGDEFAARQCVEQALDLVALQGGMRALIDGGGTTVASFLRDQSGGWSHHEELVEHVVRHFGNPPGLANPLTERELTVLRQLPTMMTLEEIAASMLVSVNTVKTHLRNVYRKLEVSSRRDAVSEARRWGLL